MKKIKIISLLLICLLIVLVLFNYKHSYYGYTKSYFNQTPKYLRPHFRGSDLGNRGFSIVKHDINLNIIGTHNRISTKNGVYVHFKHISGYYYNQDNLIVEGVDKNNESRLVLITYENYKNHSFNLLDSVPEGDGYKQVVIPTNKYTYYITNYLILTVFILLIFLLYYVIKFKWKKGKE